MASTLPHTGAHVLNAYTALVRSLAAALTAVLLAGCAASANKPRAPQTGSEAAEPPYRIERQQYDLVLTPEVRRVRVINAHGDVTVKATSANSVGVYAIVQLIGAQPEAPIITTEVRGDEALVEVRYASDATIGADTFIDGYRKGRVDLGMFIPTGPRVEIESTFGAVNVKPISNDVHVRGREGRVTVATSGAIQVATDSGPIDAWPMTGKFGEPMRVRSRSGRIQADVPLYAEISFSVVTGGTIDSEVELARATEPDGRTRGTLKTGSGVQLIEIESETGDVRLARADRSPLPEPAD